MYIYFTLVLTLIDIQRKRERKIPKYRIIENSNQSYDLSKMHHHHLFFDALNASPALHHRRHKSLSAQLHLSHIERAAIELNMKIPSKHTSTTPISRRKTDNYKKHKRKNSVSNSINYSNNASFARRFVSAFAGHMPSNVNGAQFRNRRNSSFSTYDQNTFPVESATNQHGNGNGNGNIKYNKNKIYVTRTRQRSNGQIMDRNDDSGASQLQNDELTFNKEHSYCCLHELPDWYSPYTHILNGYRLNYSPKEALRSAFKWHNETLNIWTGLCLYVFLSLA